MQRPAQGTIAERERLMPDRAVKMTGFTPRPSNNLATARKRTTSLDLEISHFLKTDETTPCHPSLNFQLWQEVGKHEPAFPEKPDPQYNCNVWRNFTTEYGLHHKAKGARIDQLIASMYPLNVPMPSRLGEYSYDRFLRDSRLFKDPKKRKLAVEKTKRDLAEFYRLRMLSDQRNPPLTELGSIIPPKHYRKYEVKYIPPPEGSEFLQPPPPEPTGESRVDIFGQRVPRIRHTPFIWKLSYADNHPDYVKLKEKQKKDTSLRRPEAVQERKSKANSITNTDSQEHSRSYSSGRTRKNFDELVIKSEALENSIRTASSKTALTPSG